MPWEEINSAEMRQRTILLTVNVTFIAGAAISRDFYAQLERFYKYCVATLPFELCSLFVTLLQVIISRNCFREQLDAR